MTERIAAFVAILALVVGGVMMLIGLVFFLIGAGCEIFSDWLVDD
jgi:hypothetical protein